MADSSWWCPALLVVGAGPMRESLTRLLPANVRLVSDIDDAQLGWAYATSSALIAPFYEDLGLTVREAAAWGKPTFALRVGGYLDTVVEGVTGANFDTSDADAIRLAVAKFPSQTWDGDIIRAHAETFSEARFSDGIHEHVHRMIGPRTAALSAATTG